MAKKEKEPDIYIWEGTNKRGAKLKGEITGTSTSLVKAELRRQGLTPTKVRKKPKPLFEFFSKKNIKSADIAVFTRQLSTMLSSGVPLMQAFDILGRGHTNPKMQEILLNIKSSIEAGNSLSTSLREYKLYFNDLFCNLIDAGEQSGSLDIMLDRLATYREKTESIKGKIKKALFYPTAVVVIAFLITAGMLIFVVPKFKDIFTGFGADLPAPTLFVMSASEIFEQYWYIIFAIIIGGIFGLIRLKKSNQKFSDALDVFSLKIPIIGPILHKAAVARFARTLSTTFAAGMPLVDALEAVAGATGNVLYREATLNIRDDVSTGTHINVSMRSNKLFPSMVVQMVAIGEEAGSLEFMLAKVADFYEEDVDNAVDNLSSLLEPIIMVVLGVLIGGLVVAMYLPIFKLGSVI